MIIMPVKEGENIERALKKFKRKYERTGVLNAARHLRGTHVPRRGIDPARSNENREHLSKMFPVLI